MSFYEAVNIFQRETGCSVRTANVFVGKLLKAVKEEADGVGPHLCPVCGGPGCRESGTNIIRCECCRTPIKRL